MAVITNCTFSKKRSRWSVIWDALRGRLPVVVAQDDAVVHGCTFTSVELLVEGNAEAFDGFRFARFNGPNADVEVVPN